MNPLKKEVAVVLGVIAAVGEVLVQAITSGTLHDVLVVVLPILAAFGVRANVTPVKVRHAK